MGTTSPSSSISFLRDLGPFDRDELIELSPYGALVRRYLTDAGSGDAFALFAVDAGGSIQPIAGAVYSPASVRRLEDSIAARSPSLEAGDGGPVPVSRLVDVDPATLVEGHEPPPSWVLPLRQDGVFAGLLVGAGESGRWTADARRVLADLVGPAVAARRTVAQLAGAYEFVWSVLNDVSTGLIAIDPLGRVIFLNQSARTILAVAESDAIGADGRRVFRTLVDGENVLLKGLEGDVQDVEIWVRRLDGREIPVELRISQIRSRRDEVLGAVGIFRDLSERRSMQERIRHRDRLATIGELAAGIAHEIGNPLTGIRGCAQILRDRLPADDSSHELIGVILEEVDRLSRLANQVRHYVRPGAPRMQKAGIGRCLDRVLSLVGHTAEQSGIAIHRDEGTSLPELWHDPDQIQQVLHNLIQNALDAMAAGGGRLEIEVTAIRRPVPPGPRHRRRAGDRLDDASARPLEREYVRVRISDTGPGIDEDAQSRIFNPFFTTKPSGLGLGLSISQTIVSEHGGFLSVVSQVGKGTTFTLDLPVDRRVQ